jgi:hypothetical protein
LSLKESQQSKGVQPETNSLVTNGTSTDAQRFYTLWKIKMAPPREIGNTRTQRTHTVNRLLERRSDNGPQTFLLCLHQLNYVTVKKNVIFTERRKNSVSNYFLI